MDNNYITPTNLAEFIALYPNFIGQIVRKFYRNGSDDFVADMTQEMALWLHEKGIIQKFDVSRIGQGDVERWFLSFIKHALQRRMMTIGITESKKAHSPKLCTSISEYSGGDDYQNSEEWLYDQRINVVEFNPDDKILFEQFRQYLHEVDKKSWAEVPYLLVLDARVACPSNEEAAEMLGISVRTFSARFYTMMKHHARKFANRLTKQYHKSNLF